MKLGEIFTPGLDPDATYTGETGSSVFSMQYYRNKALQFQDVLFQLDKVAQSAQAVVDADASPELTADLADMLAGFDAKKVTFRATAEAINLGAASINAMGGRMPEMQVPTGLGVVPLVVPAAMIAAIGVAAALITWGVSWIAGVRERLLRAQTLNEIADPELRGQVAAELVRVDAAAAATNESSLSSVAGIVKWGVIGVLAWMAWQAWEQHQRG